ncbi:MAG: TIGR01906 family membrane protein [Turicibacter sp.]|nr:TIGR01906 family membrane protein [Turicibacter sp.]
MKYLAGYAVALCLLVLIVAQSVFIPSFHMEWYFRWHYEQHDVARNIGISEAELMYVTDELLNYMRGRRENLIVYVTIDEEVRSFFSDRDIRHMADVRELYAVGFLIRNIVFWVLILIMLGVAFFKVSALEVIPRCCLEVLIVFLVLLVALAGVIAWDWNRAFVIFHEMFFDNDYWILTSGVDPLIDMVGHPFFLYIAIIVGGLIFGFSGVVIAASAVYMYVTRPSGRVHTVIRFRQQS